MLHYLRSAPACNYATCLPSASCVCPGEGGRAAGTPRPPPAVRCSPSASTLGKPRGQLQGAPRLVAVVRPSVRLFVCCSGAVAVSVRRLDSPCKQLLPVLVTLLPATAAALGSGVKQAAAYWCAFAACSLASLDFFFSATHFCRLATILKINAPGTLTYSNYSKYMSAASASRWPP
eukprot:COSAG06_NODE_3429_length_5357_cov_51.676996_5_plen_176_part_00